MNQRKISYVPGLHKIFDEITVKGASNCANMDRLDLTIHTKASTITIRVQAKAPAPWWVWRQKKKGNYYL
jgi:hypothetical protein